MKNLSLLLTGILVLSLATVAFAGDYGKCEASAQECVNYLAAKAEKAGYSGLDGDYNKEEHTWTVTAVTAGAPAEVAGFQVGDVVVGTAGKYFKDFDEAAWKEFEMGQVAGATMKFKVKRAGEYKKLAVTYDVMPDAEKAKMVGKHMIAHAELASSGS